MTTPFHDSFKMPHPQPNERSDNGVLFMVEEKDLSKCLAIDYDDSHFDETFQAHQFKEGEYAQTPWNPQDPSSHDNTTAIVSDLYQRDEIKKIRELKVIGKFWHPRDIAYYWWCKKGLYRLMSYSIWWFVYLAQWSTCNDEYKVRNNVNIVDTDGKLLAFVRLQATMKDSWLMRKSWGKCVKTLSKHTEIKDEQHGGLVDLSDFGRCFMYYFKNPEHPNHKLGKQYSEMIKDFKEKGMG